MADFKRNSVEINGQYFSGAQVSVFIGDTWIDDIVSISYQTTHQRQPVYGYGSQHFDLMPKGTILVAGEFSINFREPNYLWMVLERYKTFNPTLTTRSGDSEEKKMSIIKERIRQDNITSFNATFPDDPRRNIQNFFDADVKNAARVKEALSGQFYSKPKSARRSEKMNHNSFSITIGYGDLGPSTVGEKINDIHIMGKSKLVQIDGRPVMETYSFIARDNS